MTEIPDLELLFTLQEDWWEFPSTDRKMLRILQSFYKKNPNARINPRRQWFADKLGLKVCAISRSLSRLRQGGYLETTFRGNKGNRYVLPNWLRKLDLKNPKKWLNIEKLGLKELKILLKAMVNVQKKRVNKRRDDQTKIHLWDISE